MILNDGLNDGFTEREVLNHSFDPYCLEVCCGDSPLFFNSASESAVAEQFFNLDMRLFDAYTNPLLRAQAYHAEAEKLKQKLKSD